MNGNESGSDSGIIILDVSRGHPWVPQHTPALIIHLADIDPPTFRIAEKRLNKAIIDNRGNEGNLANNLRRFERNRTAFRGEPSVEQPSKLWTWTGENYRKYSKVFGDQISRNSMFKHVAKVTKLEPSNLALGIAEGLICYKLTWPIHAPLELYLVVKLFQNRGAEEVSVEKSSISLIMYDIVHLIAPHCTASHLISSHRIASHLTHHNLTNAHTFLSRTCLSERRLVEKLGNCWTRL